MGGPPAHHRTLSECVCGFSSLGLCPSKDNSPVGGSQATLGDHPPQIMGAAETMNCLALNVFAPSN